MARSHEDPTMRGKSGRPVALLRCLGLALALAATLPGTASSEEWVQVASGGLGVPGLNSVEALEIHGASIYAASNNSAVVPFLHRALLSGDDTWEDVTPPGWSAATGGVSDMLSLGGSLWVGTTQGQLWRLGADGAWVDFTPPATVGREIFGLAAWKPPDQDDERLTGMWRGVRIGYLEPEGLWRFIETPSAFRAYPFQSGTLASWEGRLYAGVGGGAAGSRTAQVWFLGRRHGPYPVTTDGFGHEEMTWVNDIVDFAGSLYIGTGGHFGTAGIFRTPGVRPEDVTPCEVFGCDGPYPFVPQRYRLQVAAGRLYAGTNGPVPDGTGGNVANVLASADGDAWVFSAAANFGVPSNEAISALEGSRPHLYAGTVNRANGFEIWRRTPLLTEMLPFLAAELQPILARRAKVLGCVRRAGCRGWRSVLRPVDEIRTLFETARHPQDDPAIIGFARARLEGAQARLREAVRLVRHGNKASRSTRARHLRSRAAAKVREAIAMTLEACRTAGVPVPE